MGVKERAVKAINAMKDMGFAEKRVKLVLKNLLRLYDKNWELIEDDHYAVLIDAIFGQEEEETTKKNEEKELLLESAGPPLKKMCLRDEADAASGSGELTLRSKIEGGDLPVAQCREHDLLLSKAKDKDLQALALPSTLSSPDEEDQSQLCLRDRFEHRPISRQLHSRDKGKDPMLPSSICSGVEISKSRTQVECSSPQMTHKEKGGLQARSSFAVGFKEPKIEPGIIISSQENLHGSRQSDSLIIPKSEPSDNYIPFEVPISTAPPINSGQTINADMHSALNESTEQVNGVEALASKGDHNANSDTACEAVTSTGPGTVPEKPMTFEIASSSLGEVKLSLCCSQTVKRPGVYVPSVDEVLKAVEDKCLRSYRIMDPDFSMKKLFQEMCQTFLDHGSQHDKVQLPTSFSDGSSNGQRSA